MFSLHIAFACLGALWCCSWFLRLGDSGGGSSLPVFSCGGEPTLLLGWWGLRGGLVGLGVFQLRVEDCWQRGGF